MSLQSLLSLSVATVLNLSALAQPTKWVYESTANGKIPKPWESTQQTASLAVDLTGDGVNDLVMACRQKPPCLIFYSKTAKGWQRYLIDKDYLTIEAGGTSVDMDNDGDNDLVLAGDWQSNKVWWWENPGAAALDPNKPWNRYEIKAVGNTQHHDQICGDFKRTGRPQVVFWNQGSKTLYIADIPANPKTDTWRFEPVFSGEAGERNSWYAEGLASGDIDGDGWPDLLGGNYWFRYDKATNQFTPIKIAEEGGRIGLGKFKPGRTMQVVVSPGDGKGKLMFYEWTGQEGKDSVANAALWKGRDLLGRTMVHGHTMEVADINGDGRLDFFTGEMAKWSEKETKPDNPNAEALIYYGDGTGNFRKEVFKTGWGFHEARVTDIDGDGDMDILSKPYNWEAPRLDVWLQNGTGKRVDLGSVQKRIGLELYSFRDQLAKDVPGTLAKVKAMGFTEVEIPGYYNLTPEQFRDALKAAGLKPTGALYGFDRFQTDVDGLIREAKLLGLKAIGCAWIPHVRLFTKADAEKGAEVFNKAGEKLKANGIGFYYHAHGYEFRPMPEGGTLFDYMAKLMKPGVADFQIDVYWALHGGELPAQLMQRYAGRIRSIHLKDMAWGQETGVYTGGAPLYNDCVHGKGQQNFKAILQAAQQTGVPTLYIEDENANALTQVPQSLAYLKSLK